MNLIAYDLGTGGVKSSLYDENLNTLAKSFFEYSTYYTGTGIHEQRPFDWWEGVKASTKLLLRKTGMSPDSIRCVALSGHSLVTVPIDSNGNVLLEKVPIWSDTRADKEADEFFRKIDETEWYLTTGNGFPKACYSIFKLMWLKKHSPDLFRKIDKVLGSKDYINCMLTGRVYTDYSYASGTGAYNLLKNSLEDRYLAAAGIPKFIFPEIVPSHTIIGQVTKWAAKETGLAEGTPVACGGVDNACMALGAVGPEEGRIYTSLGSSSWIPVNSARPVLDPVKKPYVFAHICEGMYTSAFSIFAGGSSLRWVRETICRDISEESSAYRIMDEMAERVPVGSNGLIFNPSLAGGTSQDKSVNIQGAFLGLHLGSTREDMIRAAMEGIALNLKMSYECLRQHTRISAPILFCGGGSKSKVWMQMFADVFNVEIIKTNIDQDAASLGAAAIAAKAVGWWKDYRQIRNLHHIENRSVPNPQNVEKYQRLFPIFEHATGVLADFGDFMEANLLQ